jgi:hypothetical protein
MRTLSAAVTAAIAAQTITLAIFVEVAFADNTLYFWSGLGSIAPSGPPANPSSTFPYGETFTGLGWLGKISSIPQTTKIQAQNVTLSLSGIPSSLVQEAVDQVRITGDETIWIAFFDQATNTVLTDPVQVHSGSLDVPSLIDSGETSTISITGENTLLSLNLAPNRRFDDPDQQLRVVGDLGFSFVQALANIQLFWPNPAANSTPYPVYMTVNPTSVDLAVGASETVEVTIHYSDSSTYTMPSGTGSGPSFHLGLASSNPAICTFQYTTTNQLTGIAPGECSLMARVPGPSAGTGPSSTWRQVCNIFVHN